ncbi:hypothetical protein PybrP1_002826 [[Pythium] brassicae (nom. inval.)]|nr:hypothetical protein PybrP1_002826 [[Pythium] brassicae (nom. inval.)]
MVERHYCKFCNAWMQGDKAGRKHREKVEETLKNKSQAKTDAQRSERELRDQLQAIEEEALARHAKDLATAGAPPPPPPRRGQAPPPPPRRKPDDSGGKRFGSDEARSRDEHHEDGGDAEQAATTKEDDFGVYEARGSVFLEGKRHESKLETGSACEIWVEELEEWLSALIEKAEEHVIPYTGRSFRRLTVTYMAPGESQPVIEDEVYADRVRIRMPAGMALATARRMIRQMETGEVESLEDAGQAQVVVDETTGMGEWSTVVVREVDESEEAVAQREAEAHADAEALADQEKRRDALDDLSAQGDNALGAFNPWGGSYKGVQLDKAVDVDAIRISTNGDVGFKKRKRAGGDKRQKRIRSSDDE